MKNKQILKNLDNNLYKRISVSFNYDINLSITNSLRKNINHGLKGLLEKELEIDLDEEISNIFVI
jgi:hypothetical protein